VGGRPTGRKKGKKEEEVGPTRDMAGEAGRTIAVWGQQQSTKEGQGLIGPFLGIGGSESFLGGTSEGGREGCRKGPEHQIEKEITTGGKGKGRGLKRVVS